MKFINLDLVLFSEDFFTVLCTCFCLTLLLVLMKAAFACLRHSDSQSITQPTKSKKKSEKVSLQKRNNSTRQVVGHRSHASPAVLHESGSSDIALCCVAVDEDDEDDDSVYVSSSYDNGGNDSSSSAYSGVDSSSSCDSFSSCDF